MPASRKTEKPPASGRTVKPSSLLAVDVGNSETVVGRFRGRELAAFWRLTSGRLTADRGASSSVRCWPSRIRAATSCRSTRWCARSRRRSRCSGSRR